MDAREYAVEPCARDEVIAQPVLPNFERDPPIDYALNHSSGLCRRSPEHPSPFREPILHDRRFQPWDRAKAGQFSHKRGLPRLLRAELLDQRCRVAPFFQCCEQVADPTFHISQIPFEGPPVGRLIAGTWFL